MDKNISNQQILLKQGIDWLKAHKDNLVDAFSESMAHSEELPYHRLPSLLRKLIAKDMVQDLIKRLESNSFDSEEVRKKIVSGMKKGANLQSLVISTDLLVATITSQANRDLSALPMTRDVLLSKTQYFASLIKSTAATATFEIEKAKLKQL
ncbi:MAG TPA: hypothetical protein VH186_18545 [Chloroflexia bacterium]|nr:hypothetical protein [Chloroflexia bacterium]